MDKYSDILETPIGNIEIIASNLALISIKFLEEGIDKKKNLNNNSITSNAKNQFSDYFKGKRKVFDLPIESNIGTEFQNKIWQLVNEIPYGITKSYLDLAKLAGSENYTRAVATANSKNHWLLLIPCHRVVGVGGKLVGYSGGLWRKRWLLEHEQDSKQLFYFQ
jgi:O-6-methylguanine DNA methyltransferase